MAKEGLRITETGVRDDEGASTKVKSKAYLRETKQGKGEVDDADQGGTLVMV